MRIDYLPQASPLNSIASWARNWLLEFAAPVWGTRQPAGTKLFPERMDLAGIPDATYFRTFVQARHIFSFVTIGEFGWGGPWRELITETVETLLKQAKRSDGFYVHRIDADALHIDPRVDLYDQAFILLALGSAGGAMLRQDWFDEAEALLDRIEAEWKHPMGGFREGEVADPRVRRQNPHMHLLEAFIALHEASKRERFRTAAYQIADLAKAKFIDRPSGALLEYFTEDLQPAPLEEGRIVEPGHCFEWAWLFERMAISGWAEAVSLSDGLTAFARRKGIDPMRGVAINELLTDSTVRNAGARLWPQTERLKAAVARYRRISSAAEAEEVVAAANGLRKYLEVPKPGLWRDKLNADGTWVDELAPGSSLYHISCALSELLRLVSSVEILEN